MKKTNKTKKEEIFVNIAGFVVKISLFPTEQKYLKESVHSQIKGVWQDGGFFTKKEKRADFEIVFREPNNKIYLIQKEKGKKHYYLVFERDFKKRIVKTHYFTSIAHLNMIVREIVVYLLRGLGFLVHASALIDKKGNFYVFMAKSGGGKTTVADTISKNSYFEKVADDSLIVKKQNGEWYFYSSPFIEKDELPIHSWSKKAKIFFVKKGKKAKVVKYKSDVIKPL
mgnify:CR=1 FL=1